MASKRFTTAQWAKIHDLMDKKAAAFGLPRRRRKSVVIGTFNIRKLGDLKGRSAGAQRLLHRICERFDLLAIQEVQDDLAGVQQLRAALGSTYGLVVSDVTGKWAGGRGMSERLAFLFKWNRIERTELASDITYDRSAVVDSLLEHRTAFNATLRAHQQALDKHRRKRGKKGSKPTIKLPAFLTFIRQPHCAAFRVKAKSGHTPYEFMTVNAHLLFGNGPDERRWEFDALIRWIAARAKQRDKTYFDNFLLLGDCNLEFKTMAEKRADIDTQLKALNTTVLRSKKAAKANFPLLTPHPKHGELRTTARLKDTYDQIGLFAFDKRLPTPDDNRTAGVTVDGYDYGVFNFANLFSTALHGKAYADLTAAQRKSLIARMEHDVSDHMPAWIRLPIPGA